jgi:predicted dienelactone hydrolase
VTGRAASARAGLLAISIGAVMLAACGGSGAAGTRTAGPKAPAGAALRDPAESGPYGVRLTKMTFERPANAGGSPRTLETWIWYPAARDASDSSPAAAVEPADGLFPIVVFSHGSGGQPNFYKYFTEHLASWGFVVAAPPHPGNTSEDCFPCSGASLIPSARERPADVEFVLDKMLALKEDPSEPLGTIIDASRTALAGHSFGGWTAVFAAKSGRFHAVISMAPGLPETLLVRAEDVHVPVLLMGGGQDELISPDSIRKLYAALPGGANTYLSLPGGHHTSFTDRCFGCTDALPEQRGHDLINRYATAFLETYVTKDERYAHYLREDVAPDAAIVHDAAYGP